MVKQGEQEVTSSHASHSDAIQVVHRLGLRDTVIALGVHILPAHAPVGGPPKRQQLPLLPAKSSSSTNENKSRICKGMSNIVMDKLTNVWASDFAVCTKGAALSCKCEISSQCSLEVAEEADPSQRQGMVLSAFD